MARIFISYKRVDKEKVLKIKNQIETELRERCWIDIDGIESDAIFASKIINAINQCEIFLFVYSKAHGQIKDYENDWTIRELNFAQDKKKRIVFINIDGSDLTDWFRLLFGTKQHVDALSEPALNRLLEDIRGWLNIPLDKENNEVKKTNLKEVKTIVEASLKTEVTNKENGTACIMAVIAMGLIVLFPAIWLIVLLFGYSYPNIWSIGISWILMILAGIYSLSKENSSDSKHATDMWTIFVIFSATIYIFNYVM